MHQPLITAHHAPELFVTCGGPTRMIPSGLARGQHHALHGPSAAAGTVFPASISRSFGTPPSSSVSSGGLMSVGPVCGSRSPVYNSPPRGFGAKVVTTSGGQMHRQNGFLVDVAAAVAAQAPSTPVTSVGSGSPEMSVFYPQQLLGGSIDTQSMVDPATGAGCSAVTMATAVEAWRTLNAVHQSAAVAAALAGYGAPCHDSVPLPFGYQQYASSYGGIDVRRKNATRESTSTLKAWLYEHIKNPYPTKGEKIMLAIVTRMTLTQVSTWFANARRRLKKENKMQWSPRNRTGEDDDDDDDDDGLLVNDGCNNNANDDYGFRSSSVDDSSRDLVVNDDEDDVVVDDDNDDIAEIRLTTTVGSTEASVYGSLPPNIIQFPHSVCGRPTVTSSLSRPKPEVSLEQEQQRRVETKPRIWSLADVATSGTNSSSSSSPSPYDGAPQGCPRVPLAALWAAPPLTPSGFQPWVNSTPQAPPAASLFQNGLFPVGGFLHPPPSSPDVKGLFSPHSVGGSRSTDADSELLLSPDRRSAKKLNTTASSSSVSSCAAGDDDERR